MHLHKPKVPNPIGCVNYSIISSPYNKLLCSVLELSCLCVENDSFVSKACSRLLKLFTFGAVYKLGFLFCVYFEGVPEW